MKWILGMVWSVLIAAMRDICAAAFRVQLDDSANDTHKQQWMGIEERMTKWTIGRRKGTTTP